MFVFMTALSFAQEKYPYYCKMNGYISLNLKTKAELEWGEQKRLVYLYDENGKVIYFNNTTDILNYMSARGWQLVTTLFYDRCTHYILKKDVSSPEEAKQGLHFSKDE